jgi:hypothetical protein
VYVAYKLYASSHTNYLDATITVPAGNHLNMTVQAKDANGVVIKKTQYINVLPQLAIAPQSPMVSEGSTQAFTASVAVTWSSTCGTIDSSGNFTAPLTQQACSVTATSTDGTGSTASTNVLISSPITITPLAAVTPVGTTQQFSAPGDIAWSSSCGTIDPTGLFTAPASPGICTITATSTDATAYTATATDTVTQPAPTTPNYTTWKNDNARDGLRSNETILTPANVNSTTFGQIFSSPLDGFVWAQPLFMSGVQIASAAHNVVYAATANASVYAFDADNGQQLWKTSLLGSGELPASGATIHSSVPKIGVTGTPVIDPSSNTIYAVTQSVSTTAGYFHRLHALDITTGAEKFGGPITISGPAWDASQHLQRPGLMLANGNVYIAFGSNGDVQPFHGWIFAYNASNLSQVAVWNDTAIGGEGGIWMGGAGIVGDVFGNLFVSTGNGDWDGKTQFGQSVVKLSPSLAVTDYFTPYDHVKQSSGDQDLGSGGLLLVPDLAGNFPHEMISCSKLNTIYMLNRDNLGHVGSNYDNVIQRVDGQLGGASGTQYADKCFSVAAFWNNNVYFIGNNDVLKQFTLDPGSGLLSTSPVSHDTFAYMFPGGQPVVSSNGANNAIVWATDWMTGTLRAYDATNVSNVLYTSPKLGGGIKFTVPTVVNGHVYLGMQNKLVTMGILPNGTCAAPSTAGVNICTPANTSSSTSPVNLLAGVNPPNGTLARIDVWLDGKKINSYYSTPLQIVLPMAVGKHSISVVGVDSAGTTVKGLTSVNVTAD